MMKSKMYLYLIMTFLLLSCFSNESNVDDLERIHMQAKLSLDNLNLDNLQIKTFKYDIDKCLEILKEQKDNLPFLNAQNNYKKIVYTVESGEIENRYMLYFYKKNNEILAYYIHVSSDWELKYPEIVVKPKELLMFLESSPKLETSWSAEYRIIVDLEKGKAIIYDYIPY